MRGSKNAIVTGSNRGMGRAIVKRLAADGYNIWACARTESDEFEQFASNLALKEHVWVKPVYFDMQSSESIKAGFKGIYQEKKNIDILVNNAGTAEVGSFSMATPDKIDKVFRVNTYGPMVLTQYVLKRMQQQKSGSIINIASISGLDALSGNCIYGASKAALIAFTRCLSAELGSTGIRVNAVAPGSTDTDMLECFAKIAVEPLAQRSALGRVAQPEEIASVVAFLASEDASYINGQVLRVDGGSN